MARSTVAVKFTGDTSSLKSAVSEVDGKMKGLGGKIGGFGKVAAAGVAGGVAAVGVMGKSAVDAGSDLNETLSKSNTVFGDQAASIEKWAGKADKNLGQSKQQALEAASSFGNMFTQLGIGEGTAAEMSTTMTELASDFASFHNADISEVLNAQQAAFRGEYDAVQKFVPTINAAAVEQKALEMGLADTAQELTAQDKAWATQKLLVEGAGKAQGDFARTSDGLANKQRIMSAQFENMQAKIGQALIPVVLKLSDVFLNKVVPAVQRIVAVVQEKWPQIQATINGAVQGVIDFVTPIIATLQSLWDTFGNNILEHVQRVWPAIRGVIEGALNLVRGIIQTITSLIKGDWSGVWEGIKTAFSGIWDIITNIPKVALEDLRTAISLLLEAIGIVFRGAWDGMIEFFKGVPEKLKTAGSGLFDFIKTAFKNVINWVIRGWNKLEFRIPGFDPPGPGPKFGGFTLGVPDIPELATGGQVMKSGLAVVHRGERFSGVHGEFPIGGGNTYHINVTPQHEPTAQAVVRELRRFSLLAGN